MMSDNGSQMVGAADSKLREGIEGWDVDKRKTFCAEKGIQWKFVTPAPRHQSGCVESLVKTC